MKKKRNLFRHERLRQNERERAAQPAGGGKEDAARREHLQPRELEQRRRRKEHGAAQRVEGEVDDGQAQRELRDHAFFFKGCV